MNHGKYLIGIRLMLLKQYLEANAGKDRYVKRGEIEEYLTEQGFPVEKKTLYRDFQFLQADLGMQLEYDTHKKGYRLLNPPFEPYELRLMVDGIQSSKFITKVKAREITGKIKALAGKSTIESLDRQIYVADRVRSMNDSVVKDSDRIHEAIRADKKISFRYFHYTPNKNSSRSYSKDGQPYIVSPYAFLWSNGNYYLYAFDGEIFRYFRVDRMDHISCPMQEHRAGKELFREQDIASQKVKVFDMYAGEEHTVRICFHNKLAGSVIDQFGKNIMMIPYDDNHFAITAPIQISPPFFAWIATFGDRVKILSPEPVVEQMKDFLQRSMNMYKDDGEK